MAAWLETRMFCEENLKMVNAKDLELFQNRLVHEFYGDYFGTSEYLSSREKKESSWEKVW